MAGLVACNANVAVGPPLAAGVVPTSLASRGEALVPDNVSGLDNVNPASSTPIRLRVALTTFCVEISLLPPAATELPAMMLLSSWREAKLETTPTVASRQLMPPPELPGAGDALPAELPVIVEF